MMVLLLLVAMVVVALVARMTVLNVVLLLQMRIAMSVSSPDTADDRNQHNNGYLCAD